MVDGIVITGATATGKTGVAVAVAKRLGGEIISMDSRQVYRGMDIGTAKPAPAELQQVPHHGIDILSPDERYSAGRFARDARQWIREIRQRKHVPVLVGGTGFFLKALTDPMFAEPALESDRKEQLKHYLGSLTREELLRWLAVLDHEAAHRLEHAGGRQRAARALEIALLTGRSLSDWHAEQQPEQPLRFMTFVLELPRDELYERINRRVDAMIEAGLPDEVRSLVAAGFDQRAPGMNATGYIELLPYLRGEATLEEAADAIKRATRRYARRQHTWFRHQLPPDAVTLDARQPVEELVNSVTSLLNSVPSVS